MNREDRETILIVGIIMIVSTISLVAVLVFLWQIVGPPLGAVISQIQYGISVNRTNYNFAYPGMLGSLTEQKIITQKGPKPNYYFSNPRKDLYLARFLQNPDYNFNYPDYLQTTSSWRIGIVGISDQLISDEQLTQISNNTINIETALSLNIASVGIDGPILQGYNYDELIVQGFWMVPGSMPVGEGGVVLMCQRRLYLPFDGRSCWYLDELRKGDEIVIKKGEQDKVTYIVNTLEIYDEESPSVLQIREQKTLRLITSTPIGSNSKRLVVEAIQKSE